MQLENYEILLMFGLVLSIGFLLGRKIMDYEWRLYKLDRIVKDRIKRSRVSLSGQFSEQLAPYLPDFPHSPTEARFIGKPIDFIVFKGADSQNISEVIFIEVKSGKSRINKHERILRDTIKDKKVSWEEYRIPKNLTERSNESD